MNKPLISDDILFERVQIGEEAANFVENTPLGKSLYEQAVYEYKISVMEFEDLSIEEIMKTPEKVVQVKQRMEISKLFLKWVSDTVSAASSAENELKRRDMSDETID